MLLVVSLSLGFVPSIGRAADPPSGTLRGAAIGTPLGTGKLVIEVTLVLGGKKVPKKVEIKDGDIKAFVMPTMKPNQALRDYAQDVLNAQGEASHAKAQVIADAINAEYAAEFAKLPDQGKSAMVGVGFVIKRNQTIRVNNQNVPGLQAPFGQLVIPNVLKEKDPAGKDVGAFKITEGKILGEGGNLWNFDNPPPTKPSAGAKASLEGATPGISTVALGVDPLGDPSVVEFGIDGSFVAQFKPAVGATDEDVLKGLEAMLDSHGIPATFDPSDVELSLDMPLLDGQVLAWGNTDIGLEFSTVFAGLDAPVPEPGSLALLGMVLTAMVLVGRRTGSTE
jgi:hypothetical protein